MIATPGSLNDIAAPVRPHLERFERVFRESIRSRVGLVDLVARYIIRQKGKRIRPILVLLSADVCGGITEKTYRGAALVEILHTATLVHDDVVDDADTRRGLASINAVWKNKVAVLMGDYLLARGLLLSLDNGDVGFLRITSTSVKRMSEGEIHQIQRVRKLDIDEESYLRIISDKTASLLSTCCEIGATSVSEDPELALRLREYGENIGIAFQIRDDILDLTGRRSVTGKPEARDLREKKLTLPVIYAIRRASRKKRNEILTMIRNGGKKMKVVDVVRFVDEAGGITYAEEQARRYAAEATRRLDPFPDSPAKRALTGFASFVVKRDR